MGLGVCLSHCLQSCDCVVGLQEQEVIFSLTKLHNTVLNTAFFAVISFNTTRSCAALRAADLDWIVGPEYSLGGYISGRGAGQE